MREGRDHVPAGRHVQGRSGPGRTGLLKARLAASGSQQRAPAGPPRSRIHASAHPPLFPPASPPPTVCVLRDPRDCTRMDASLTDAGKRLGRASPGSGILRKSACALIERALQHCTANSGTFPSLASASQRGELPCALTNRHPINIRPGPSSIFCECGVNPCIAVT